MEPVARALWMNVVFPLWIAAGLLDWACHRRTHIERNAGLPENLFHLLLFAQMGVGLVAVALLEINGGLLLVMATVFAVHQATVYLELRYAAARRPVGPFEQMVHSFLELLPLVSLALLAVIAHDRLGDFSLRLATERWPVAFLVTGLAAVLLLNLLPLLEEGFRCLRARQLRRRTPAPPEPR